MAHALLMAFFAAVLVALAAVDIRTRRLPNRIVLPAAAIVMAGQVALDPGHALEWVVSSLGAALFLLVPALLNPEGLGMGDVKLALLLGAALGWAVAPALLIGMGAAALVGIGLIVRNGWAARKTTIPLGPFLAFGGLVALFF